MPKSRPPYPAEFRQQMIELVQAGKMPVQLAREFGCSAQAIRNWVDQAAADVRRRPPSAKDPLSTAEREELARLRRQVRQLQMERDILAKATAWFAGNSDATSKTSTRS
jgi:transposase